MEFLTGWITNIILFVLLATVIDMLLPSSAMQKYAKMVIGLLLIATILTPVLRLFTADFENIMAETVQSFNGPEEKNMENLMELKKKEIQASQRAYILEQMAAGLKAGVEEELMEDYEMAIESIDVTVKNDEQPQIPEDLQGITVKLAPAEIQGDEVAAVAKVVIDTSSPLPEQNVNLKDVKEFLAAQWAVEEEMIEIAGERRGSE
ncbi:stage III sporulation protein AF [Peribacillus saganii]|uniref:Stage III sporulation protein AF n=1 Tax=Peribacillus saganii TaxID=2303992 RepID=A0A372LRB8_9BACI|nr:stage III sporulation protein AF [Peribacillus saganii]RFU69789.1 stage III sporulation protein AF [Peribacillus saganii]